jgi:uncharacterized membrane protein YraQ (UPF0718 family)
LAAVVALGGEHHIPVHEHEAIGFTDIFTALAIESAPALLMAFALAALVQIALPGAWPRRMRAGGGAAGAARGVVFGLPLPICSCGVVPLYEALVAQAVPATAALAFLVAAPALGIDSVLISLPLLGGSFTAVRVAAAVFVALLVGLAVGRAIEGRRPAPLEPAAERPHEPRSAWRRVRAGLRFGFGDVADHTAPWIVLGMALASLAEPALRAGWLAALPWGVDVVLFALLGMPIYVPASGAIPLVAVLINKGLSPGAALALLLTGPVINAMSFGVLARLHGRRAAAAFGALVAACAVGLGLLANLVLPGVDGIALYQEASSNASALQVVCLAGFVLVVALSVLRQGPRGFVGQILSPYGPRPHSHGDDDGEGGHDHGHAHEPARDHRRADGEDRVHGSGRQVAGHSRHRAG